MNIFRKIIPVSWIKYYKMLRARFRFSDARIDSGYVSINCQIGRKVVIAPDCVIEDDVIIGDYTYMQSGCNVNNTCIGKFCSIGNNVLINPWQHPLNLISSSPKLYRNILKWGGYIDTPKQTVIGNDVWIGSGSCILDNITIGDGAVIGANSVVTKDVPPYAICVGNPAKIIKYRFDDTKIKQLLDEKWWNWDDEKIRINEHIFHY